MKKEISTVLYILLLSTFAGAQYVGIGTTTPMAPLDVAGDARINGLTVGRGAGNLSNNTVIGVNGLHVNSTGVRNVSLGFNSLYSNTTGFKNVANGAYSLFSNTAGFYNCSIGDDALTSNTTGAANTGIGMVSLYSNSTGNSNTALGYGAGFGNITGSGNTFIGNSTNAAVGGLENATAIGYKAFVTVSNSLILGSINGVNDAEANTNVGIGTTTPAALLDVAGDALIHGLTVGLGSGNILDNTVIGNASLSSNTTGYRNVGIGYEALHFNTTGFRNVAVGSFCMKNNTTGWFNSAFGDNALYSNTDGSYNMAIGFEALYANTQGYENVALGPHALYSNTNGAYNTATGNEALYSNTTGSFNIAIGDAALYLNTTGGFNVAVGREAGLNSTGSGNTFIGVGARPAINDLSNVAAIGGNALVGSSNSIVLGSISGVNGASADTKVGIGTTTPQARLDVAADILINGLTIGRGAGNVANNTAIGTNCLSSNTTGNRNVGIGMDALNHNISGDYNVANGSRSLLNNTTGSYNSAFGDDAMNANTTGSVNTAIGQNALPSNIDGQYNIAIGSWAGYQNVSGSENTFIGTNANPGAGGLTNATAIGNRAFVTANNSLVLGSINGLNGANVNTNVGIGTSTPAARLDVAADILVNGITAGHGAGNITDNTAFGLHCLAGNTTGTRNTAIGMESMHQNTFGTNNVATGSYALYNNVAGSFNSAFGDDALNSNTEGTNNTALGSSALYSNTSGSLNLALGREAGYNNTYGSGNTFIGAYAKPAAEYLYNTTAIGAYALVGSDNSLVLGGIQGVNGASANTKVGIGTTTPTVALEVVGQFKASAWKTASMSSNGYAEMGGVLLQWGTSSYTSNSAVTITFPKIFTNVYSVTATVDAVNNSGSGANVPVKVMNIGNNTFQIAGTASFSGDNVSKVRWMAVGN